MLVDLHAHFPMHLLADDQQRTHERARTWWRQRWQGWLVDVISRARNYEGPNDTPSVCEPRMREGNVRVTLSMLYQPFDEMDLGEPYGAPPRASYFQDIVDQRQRVEDHVHQPCSEITVAHTVSELDEHLDGDTPVLIHAIEGGFQLGEDPAAIQRNVKTLAKLGVAYITVAHLFFRDIATNAPALPFLPDALYGRVFPQREDQGLTALGHHAVQAMVDEGILIDITHMSSQSIKDVFSLLDARDPKSKIPVLATHIAYRFGGLEYCFEDETIVNVAKRGGVLGCILCEHYITSGLPGVKKTFDGSVDALCRHIDKIVDLTEGYDHVAIGSDLDGYIKPALPGLEHMGRMADLQHALHRRYGPENAEKISSANALRVLRAAWGRKRPRPATGHTRGSSSDEGL